MKFILNSSLISVLKSVLWVFMGILFYFTDIPSAMALDIESKFIVRDALNDIRLKEVFREQDEQIKRLSKAIPQILKLQLESPNNCEQRCVKLCEGGAGAGSGACWKKCSAEGYSSSTCTTRCGVSTELGSEFCWNRCGQEGYSSSTCSERCGTETESGASLCWQRCAQEGYQSSTCSSRCGITTANGAKACWDRCVFEGYTSSTCAVRCGTN